MEQELLLPSNRDKFIEANKGFIYNVAYTICKRKLDWNNDDELSISLIAFNSACDSYRRDKGEFLGYAKVVIKNSLIDYFRKSSNIPYLSYNDEGEVIDYIDRKGSLIEFEKELETKKMGEEILLFSEELSKYKLNFDDLVSSSPSHIDTRETLLNLAFKCSKEEGILNYIKKKGNLPIKEIILLTTAKRKLVEKWRRYILALILILSNDEYLYLKSYLNIKVGGCYE